MSDEAVATRLASEVAKAGGRHEGATANLVHDKIALSTLYNKSMAEMAKAGELGRGSQIGNRKVSRKAPTQVGENGMRTLLSDEHAARQAAAEHYGTAPVFVPHDQINLPDSFFGTGPDSLQHMTLMFLGLEEGVGSASEDGPNSADADGGGTESTAEREHYARILMAKPDKTDVRNRDGGEGHDKVGTTLRVSVEFGFHSVHQLTKADTLYTASRGGPEASFESSPGLPILAHRYDDALDDTSKRERMQIQTEDLLVTSVLPPPSLLTPPSSLLPPPTVFLRPLSLHCSRLVGRFEMMDTYIRPPPRPLFCLFAGYFGHA